MKKLICSIIGIITIFLVFNISSSHKVDHISESFAQEIIEDQSSNVYEKDYVGDFITWYDSITAEYLALTSTDEFKNIGPRQMEELKSKFGSIHVELSNEEKENLKRCVHVNLNKFWEHTMKLCMEESAEITNERQFDDILVEMHKGIDNLFEEITTLEEYVNWMIVHYNPPVQ